MEKKTKLSPQLFAVKSHNMQLLFEVSWTCGNFEYLRFVPWLVPFFEGVLVCEVFLVGRVGSGVFFGVEHDEDLLARQIN